MMMSSCGLGFAHDFDTYIASASIYSSVALRSQLATNSISTVCSGYGQSSTHSCSILFLFEIIDIPGIQKLWLDTSIELLARFLLDFA